MRPWNIQNRPIKPMGIMSSTATKKEEKSKIPLILTLKPVVTVKITPVTAMAMATVMNGHFTAKSMGHVQATLVKNVLSYILSSANVRAMMERLQQPLNCPLVSIKNV